ncbi:MAG: PH domain-containing protein [Ruminococcus sp.]|nr:PH domain-containing protein [Ruminococcus sp.]
MKKDLFDYIWTDKKRTLFGLPLSFTRYFITETKFITRKGFLNVEEDEFELYKVTDKKLSLPFGQRMFGCATITLHVRNDTDTPVKEIKSIKNARDVLSILDKQIDMNRDKYNIRGRDMYGHDNHGEFDQHFDGEFDN